MICQSKLMARGAVILLVLALAACAPAGTPAPEAPPESAAAPEVQVESARAPTTESPVRVLAYAPDGAMLVSGHGDGMLLRRDTAGAAIAALNGHEGAIVAIAVSPDGARIATIGEDKRTRIQSADGSSVWTVPESLSLANSVDFSPDGETLAEAYWEKLEFWPMADPSTGATRAQGLEPSIRLARYAPDGSALAVALANTGLAQPAILHLDPQDGAVLRSVTPPMPVEALVYAPDGSRYATATAEGVQIWTAEGAAPEHTLDVTDVRAMAFRADGSSFYTAAQPGAELEVTRWSLEDGTALDSRTIDANGYAAVAFAPDLSAIAVGDADGAVTVTAIE
jgi:WD40 repeat protein